MEDYNSIRQKIDEIIDKSNMLSDTIRECNMNLGIDIIDRNYHDIHLSKGIEVIQKALPGSHALQRRDIEDTYSRAPRYLYEYSLVSTYKGYRIFQLEDEPNKTLDDLCVNLIDKSSTENS